MKPGTINIGNIKKRPLLIGLNLSLIIAISLFIYKYFPAEMEEQYTESMRSQTIAIIGMTAQNLAPVLYFSDYDNLNETIDYPLSIHNVINIKVNFRNSGTGRPDSIIRYATKYKQKDLEELQTHNLVYSLTRPINFNKIDMGYITLNISLEEISKKISDSRQKIFYVSLGILLLGFGFVILITGMILNPLQLLNESMKQVASGDLDKRIERGGKDEFGEIITSFNMMVSRLNSAQRELAKFNNELEKRVADRTRDLQKEISERKLVEEQIRLSEYQYRNIFESAPIGIFRISPDGKLLKANPAFLKMMGYDDIGELEKNDEIPKVIYNIFDKHNFSQLIEQEGQIIDFEIKMKSHEDQERYFSESMRHVKFENIGINYYEGIIRDITDIVENEEELRQLNTELELRVDERTAQLQNALYGLEKAKDELALSLKQEKELSDLKGRFISMVSHEYRTPLSAIMLALYILEKAFNTQDKELFSKHVGQMRLSIDSMNSLLNDVLLVNKFESGKIYLELVKTNLTELVGNVISALSKKNKRDINFINNIQNETIQTDFIKLKNIISNLLSNALKYSEKDSIVELELSEKGDNVIFEVRDSGIGIPGKDRDKIFESFHRGANIGAIEGTGLGLSITKYCVNMLQGQIDVVSEENKGTKIRVVLPRL